MSRMFEPQITHTDCWNQDRHLFTNTRPSVANGSPKPVILSLRAESARQPSGRRGEATNSIRLCAPRRQPARSRAPLYLRRAAEKGKRLEILRKLRMTTDFWLAVAWSGCRQSLLHFTRCDQMTRMGFLKRAASQVGIAPVFPIRFIWSICGSSLRVEPQITQMKRMGFWKKAASQVGIAPVFPIRFIWSICGSSLRAIRGFQQSPGS